MSTTPQPVTGPSVWRGDEFEQLRDRWLIRWDADDLDVWERVIADLRDVEVTSINRGDLELGPVRAKIDAVRTELAEGTGVVLLRGLPIYERFSPDDAVKIYWALGLELGDLVTQNAAGDLLGGIKHLGDAGAYGRRYATNESLSVHTDSADVVGLLCLGQAALGGESLVASSMYIYNTILQEHPEYVPILSRSFPEDLMGEVPPGGAPFFSLPVFSSVDGTVSASVRTNRLISAMRFEEVPRLTADEMSALLYLESIPKRPGVLYSMTMEIGDVQLLNNWVTVHSRRSFVDDPEDPRRQRHLVRLWIAQPDGRPVCEEFAAGRAGLPRRPLRAG